MTHLDDLELVISLACTVDDRTRGEQQALLRIAVRVEAERNATTTVNIRSRLGEPPSRLVDYVEFCQPVRLSERDREKVDRRRAGFLAAHDEPFVRLA